MIGRRFDGTDLGRCEDFAKVFPSAFRQGAEPVSWSDRRNLPQRKWRASNTRHLQAATTGVETSTELIKFLLVGADVVVTASALVRHCPGYGVALLDGLCEWMARRGFAAVQELRGLIAVPVTGDETARECGDYLSALRQADDADYGLWWPATPPTWAGSVQGV